MIREAIIARLVAGRKALDIGSVGQSDEYCLWDLVSEHAAEARGIDLPEAEDTLERRFEVGTQRHADDPRIVRGNMETHDLGERFDVIVAGDMIEHVSNQGLFLDNCKRHLEDDGRLVITTPNAKWLTVVFRPNPTHTLWHDRHTLTHLLERHGFAVETLQLYVGNKPRYGPLARLLALHQSILAVARHA